MRDEGSWMRDKGWRVRDAGDLIEDAGMRRREEEWGMKGDILVIQ